MIINRNRKKNEEIDGKLETTIYGLRKSIQLAEEILEDKESRLWNNLQKIISEKISEKDNLIRNFDKMDQRQVDITLAEKRELDALYHFLDNIEKNLVFLKRELKSSEEQFEQRKLSEKQREDIART